MSLPLIVYLPKCYQQDGPVEWIGELLGEVLFFLFELDHHLHLHCLG